MRTSSKYALYRRRRDVKEAPLNSILLHLSKYRKEAVLAPLFKLLEACFDLAVPLVVAAMIDQGIAKNNRAVLWTTFLILTALAAIGLSMAVAAQYFAAKAATGFASGLRRAAFEKIQKLSFAQIDRFGSDSLATRLTSDANQAQIGLNLVLRLFMRSPVVVFGATIMAFYVDPRAALVFLVALPALAVVVVAVLVATTPLYLLYQRRLDAIALATRENIVGARVLRAFNLQATETKRFETLTAALLATQKKAAAIAGLMNPATFAIVNLAVAALIYVGAARVQIGAATQGETVALVGYMTQILVELVKLANLTVQTNKAVACAKRLAEVIDAPEGMTEGAIERVDANASAVAVSFRNASLVYPGASAAALEGISFDAKVGQTIGVIGGVGSGKSTLVNLIPRFYDATSGEVVVFGRDVREYRLGALRDAIGVAPQKAELFRGTIGSNLRWGDENATDADLDRALTVAQAKEFVDSKPGRLEYELESNGRNLSGGQRQRLTIARALVKEPKILILDDSSSALDYATDAKLRAALKAWRSPTTTTFVVSQRAASTRDADAIFVLDEGRLVGVGTHDELLRSNEAYREIYYSQFPEEKPGGEKEDAHDETA